MALGMEVRLSPGNFMLHAGPSPSPKKGRSPPFFGLCLLRPNASAWIKMQLGTEVGFGSGDIVLHGDPAHTPHKGGRAPNFRPIFIVAKRLDASRCHHATWFGGRPHRLRPDNFVVDGDPAAPPQKGRSLQFSVHVYCGQTAAYMDQGVTWYGGRPRPTRHCVRRGPSSPTPKDAQPPIFGQCPLWPNRWMD